MKPVHNPYYVQRRKPLTDKQRLEMFIAHDGLCCICEQRIKPGEGWWDEHERALWTKNQGEEIDLNDPKNRGPAHVKCARVKTAAEARERHKGRRVAESHFGAKRAKTRPMACGRNSTLKKKMNGKVVNRFADETD